MVQVIGGFTTENSATSASIPTARIDAARTRKRATRRPGLLSLVRFVLPRRFAPFLDRFPARLAMPHL
ncbi:hypothetical protein ACFQBU_00165 [Jhaorihella thermophila]